MANSGIQYGECFQGVEDCHPGVGKTIYKVKVVDIGDTFSKGQLDPVFMINAATLDGVFQGLLGSLCSSRGKLLPCIFGAPMLMTLDSTFGLDRPLLPMSIKELEVSANIPTDPGSILACSCTSQKHGFNEVGSDITVLDKELTKVLLSVVDFRTSEVELDDTETSTHAGAVNVDPADIVSEIRWMPSLDLMDLADVSRVALDAASTFGNSHDALLRLVSLSIHQQPSSSIVELAINSDGLSYTSVSQIRQGILLPTQVRYALVENDEESKSSEVFGQPFILAGIDAPEPESAVLADLTIIPSHVSSGLGKDLDKVLDRLVRVSNPKSTLLMSVDEPRDLTAKGLRLICSIPVGDECLCLYHSSKRLTNGATNGTSKKDTVTIVEPVVLTPAVQEFSRYLQSILHDEGYQTSTTAGLSNVIEGKMVVSLLELIDPKLQHLSHLEFESLRELMLKCERLIWVTSGDDPSMGMADGFFRTARNEIASARFQVLHLGSKGVDHGASLINRVLGSEVVDDEFQESDGILQIARIYQSTNENEHVRNHLHDSTRTMELSDTSALQLSIGKPGLLDTLQFVPDERLLQPIADHELEIQVQATGVNFRDIMSAMGLIPSKGLGQEASGIVLRAGKGAVASFKPGDRVCTLTLGGTMATKIRCDHRVSVKIPDNMSSEEAAGAPGVYVTAYYALVKVARLRRGQSVLVHAAAGGVGQATIQLAQYLGLVVYATVGSPDKRQLITERYGVADEHIFNSRDASFAKGIHRMTDGRGVDCVLNSLSGELLRVSWTCLATFGTFIEIGLRDVTNNMRLDMRPFSKSTTFTFINIHTLIEQDPVVAGEIARETFRLLNEGILHCPWPMTVYPVSQVEDVFRTMQQGRHRGKMVLSFTETGALAPVLCKAKDSLKLDPEATYLFVGGLGGLGRSLALEFVASGARRIAFVSRSGTTNQQAKAVADELKLRGAIVKAYCADIADESSFNIAMNKCAEELPPIKGVVQMAMVLQDAVFEKMTYEEWQVPLRPKVQGTWNLHGYFHDERPLDFMVFCSSISGITGNPGQAQYAAGNTYQDALAHYRRSQGLKAISVNLGIMRDVGVIAESVAHNFTVWENVLGIRETAFHALMKSVINGQQGIHDNGEECPAQVCIGLGTANILAPYQLPNPPWFEDPRFGPLAVSTVSSTGANSGAAAISFASKLSGSTDPAEATNLITEALVQKTADILRIPPSEVDPSRALYHYGVDSLVALEVRNWIIREMKANMSLLDILAAVPMEVFASEIAKKSKLLEEAA